MYKLVTALFFVIFSAMTLAQNKAVPAWQAIYSSEQNLGKIVSFKNNLYGVFGPHISRSSDDGVTWQLLEHPAAKLYQTGYENRPELEDSYPIVTPTALYVYFVKKDVFLKTNDGITWQAMPLPSFTNIFYDGSQFIAKSSINVYASTDLSEWQILLSNEKIKEVTGINSITIDDVTYIDGEYFVSVYGDSKTLILRTSDWQAITQYAIESNSSFSNVVKTHDGVLYAYTTNLRYSTYEVFRLTDAGSQEITFDSSRYAIKGFIANDTGSYFIVHSGSTGGFVKLNNQQTQFEVTASDVKAYTYFTIIGNKVHMTGGESYATSALDLTNITAHRRQKVALDSPYNPRIFKDAIYLKAQWDECDFQTGRYCSDEPIDIQRIDINTGETSTVLSFDVAAVTKVFTTPNTLYVQYGDKFYYSTNGTSWQSQEKTMPYYIEDIVNFSDQSGVLLYGNGPSLFKGQNYETATEYTPTVHGEIASTNLQWERIAEINNGQRYFVGLIDDRDNSKYFIVVSQDAVNWYRAYESANYILFTPFNDKALVQTGWNIDGTTSFILIDIINHNTFSTSEMSFSDTFKYIELLNAINVNNRVIATAVTKADNVFIGIESDGSSHLEFTGPTGAPFASSDEQQVVFWIPTMKMFVKHVFNHPDLDSDNDGMSDSYERQHGFDPLWNGDANLDSDNDGLTNLEEFTLGTDPKNNDTDGDGILDGQDPLPNSFTVRVNRTGRGAVFPLYAEVPKGERVVFNLTANKGFKVKSVTGCGGQIVDNVYTIDSLNASCNLTVSFVYEDMNKLMAVIGALLYD